MTVTELYNLFRNDVMDVVKPQLWTDAEVYSYMDDAYKTFVRKTDGIPDSTSDITQVQVVAGQEYAEVSPLIYKFRQASLQSDGRNIIIANNEDLNRIIRVDDYGKNMSSGVNRPGRLTHMLIGLDRNAKRGIVRWAGIPLENDVVNLTVYRMPKHTIKKGVCEDALDEILEEHHVWLLHWMRHRAYSKDDSETLNKGLSQDNAASFLAYCRSVKFENDRYKSKTRIVSYGGI